MSRRTPEELWDGDDRFARLARAALVPAGWLYGAGVGLRNRLYDTGRFGVERVDLPVVCVGNLRVGGSGKTPLVIWLVEQLMERRRRPLVVSRGYGAPNGRRAVADRIVAVAHPLPSSLPAGVIAVDAEDSAGGAAGDESVLIARRTGVPVVTGVDRARACRMAAAMFDVDVIVLDDGFQHRRLHRDLDLVIVDDGDRRGRMLPAGPLRESPRSLGRADFVIDTGRAAPPGSITMVGTPEGLVGAVARDVAAEPVDRLRGLSVLPVAGIARPKRFVEELVRLGARVEEPLLFGDHHDYSAADWSRIERRAVSVDLAVTTEKDWVKLEAFTRDAPADWIRALRYGVALHGAEAMLERIVQLDAKQG